MKKIILGSDSLIAQKFISQYSNNYSILFKTIQ